MSTMKKIKILDIGCGKNKHKSDNPKDIVIGLDKFRLVGVDVVWDLETIPLPFKDNEFDMVIAKSVLEHIVNLIPLLEEIWRILKPKGTFRVIVPHFSSERAYTNPDHKRFFGCFSFDYFTKDQPENYYTKIRFKIKKRKLVFIDNPKYNFLNKIFNPIINLYLPFYEKFLFKFISADQIKIEIITIK